MQFCFLSDPNSSNSGTRYPEVKFLNYQDRKRILITGGGGFVGSHLVDKLMLQGHEVTVADNFFTGRYAKMSCISEPLHSPCESMGHSWGLLHKIVRFETYLQVGMFINKIH